MPQFVGYVGPGNAVVPVSGNNPLPVSGGIGSSLVPSVVSGRSGSPSAIFTRPNDTTPYGIADVIGSATSANIELTNAGIAGALVQVLSASVTINRTVIPTGMTSLRLHLWDSAPTAILDNAVFSAAAADRAKYRGVIALPAVAVVGGGFVFTFADYVGRPIRLLTSSLWCNLVTDTAVSSVAAQTEYQIRLHIAEVGS